MVGLVSMLRAPDPAVAQDQEAVDGALVASFHTAQSRQS
jgi:hypothetical protein